MRLVQVQEQERRAVPTVLEPVLGNRLGFARRRAAPGRPISSAAVGRHVVVEEIEALADAGFLAQQRTAETTPPVVIAAVAQHLRQQPLARPSREADVVAHAGVERQPAGQQRRVRGQRLRRVRVGALEDDAVGGERVDRRRLDLPVAVGRQVVGAQRVDAR